MIGFRSRRRDTSALLQASLLAGTALLGVLGALVPAGAATLDLAGANTTLPRVGFFGGQAYVNGATDNVTNNGAAAAILSEGGGAAGTVYGGVVADGASRTGLTHTGGSVLLTGANRDGASGLAQVKVRGGLTVVQDPEEAQVATMPRAALALHQPDYILPIHGIGRLIVELEQIAC